MSQNAVVKQTLPSGLVQISLMRQMECGLSCTGSCESCGMKPSEELLAIAANSVGALPGDIVEVESTAGGAIGVSVLVYLLPCVTLAAGYLAGQYLLRLSETAALLPALAGLLLGFLPAWLKNRSVSRGGGPEFTIVKKLA